MSTADLFPNRKVAEFSLTSPKNEEYNCLAWAVEIADAWWDPAIGYFWPPGIERDGSVENLIKVYESLGFTKCSNHSQEKGYQKIAVYGDAVGYTHAARQLASGKWTSKLGALEDIEHASPECLAGKEYGRVVQILRKSVSHP